MNAKEILEKPGSDAVDKKKGICVVENLKMSMRFLLNDELRDNG